MRNKFYHIFTPILLLTLFFSGSCQKKGARKEFKAVPIESNSYAYSSEFYHMNVQCPIEQWDYDDHLKGYIEETVAFYKRDWSSGGMHYEDEMLNREKNSGREHPKFELNIRYDKFSSDKLQTHSYIYYTYIFTGGANGMTTVKTYNFNFNGLISQAEVFPLNHNQEIQLTRLLAKKATSMPDIFQKQLVWDGLGLNYLKPDGLTIDSTKCDCRDFRFSDNFKNFIISDEGIHFYFDKHKISHGVVGTPSILLDWHQLSPFVNKQYVPTN